MNYTKASGGGSNLLYPQQQTTINLNGSDFTKLNSSPIELIAADGTNYICVTNVFCEFYNTNIGGATFIEIGFEPLLAIAPNSACFSQYGGNISGIRGMMNYINLTYGLNNCLYNSPLVLWSPADDSACAFSFYQLTINYYLIQHNI